MSFIKQKILEKIDFLSEDAHQEILFFIEFLEWRHQKNQQIPSLQVHDISPFLLQSKNSNKYYQLGKAYWQLQNYTQAIEEFDQALQINPNFAEAYYLRGKSYHKLDNKPSAIEDFKKAARLFCENHHSDELASWTPFELGESNREEAIYYLIQYLSSTNSYENKRLAASAINKLASNFQKKCEISIPYLLDNLSNSAPQVRQYTLKTLAVMNLPNYAIDKIKAIADKDPKEYNRKIAQLILNKFNI